MEDLSFHEERKFEEWASKVETYIAKKDPQLRYACQKIEQWAKNVEQVNSDYYAQKTRSREFSLISKALPIVYEDYSNQYLRGSRKHGRYTKVRRSKISSFVYQFASFLVPLAEKIGDKVFLKERIQEFVSEYLPDLFFRLSDVEEHEIQALLKLLFKAEELRIEGISSERKMVEAEIMMRQLEEKANRDLEGESETVEFKEIIPDDALTLSKEIAAFASVKGGRIYLGIKKNGDIVGIDGKEKNWLDRLQLRIDGMAADAVQPSHMVSVNEYQAGEKTVVQINVPKGSEPVYYVRNIPYIRSLTKSRPAKPAEVKRLHLDYFIETLQKR